jgi:hypothetical protein
VPIKTARKTKVTNSDEVSDESLGSSEESDSYIDDSSQEEEKEAGIMASPDLRNSDILGGSAEEVDG